MGTRIVIADDDVELLAAISTALAGPGRTIVRARDGGELLEALAAGPVDLVITDIDMPWMSGLQAGHSLRYIGVDTPLVVISGLHDVDLEQRVAALGARAHLLRKPFELARLEALVRDLLEHEAARAS